MSPKESSQNPDKSEKDERSKGPGLGLGTEVAVKEKFMDQSSDVGVEELKEAVEAVEKEGKNVVPEPQLRDSESSDDLGNAEAAAFRDMMWQMGMDEIDEDGNFIPEGREDFEGFDDTDYQYSE